MLCEFSGVKSQFPKQPAMPVLEAWGSTFTSPIRTLDLVSMGTGSGCQASMGFTPGQAELEEVTWRGIPRSAAVMAPPFHLPQAAE